MPTRASLFAFMALGTLLVAAIPDAFAEDDPALFRARIITALMTHAREPPWSCGLRFERDDAANAVDAKTLQCIGTC